ncbi:DUF262 domain-containing protein [Myxococcus sp. AM009]|nr:DUF262 domain-containing protein [Myxococcus sp. AM009]
MASEKELVRAPAYQRKFRWSENDESRLIESLFLGLPVPSIFVATNEDGSWELVDGLQRISTLMHFIADPPELLAEIKKSSPLRLSEELSTLTTFRNKTYADLPTPIQLAFTKRSLRVTALSDKSDRKVRFELFERLNTGGVALTPQEVRACIYRGGFARFLTKLAADSNYSKLVKLQKKRQDDGTREELVLKFFAYLERVDQFDGDVKNFLTEYMQDASSKFDVDRNREFFLKVVGELAAIQDGPILRSGYHSTPLNQFEAIMVGAGRLIKSGKPVRRPKKGWLDDPELVQASTKGTNTPSMLKSRIDRATELLSGKS